MTGRPHVETGLMKRTSIVPWFISPWILSKLCVRYLGIEQ